MRLLLLIITIGLFTQITLAQVTLSSKITEATVYQKGAYVTREASLSIFQNEEQIILDSIPKEIDLKSIQVWADNDIQIKSITQRYVKSNFGQADSVRFWNQKIQELSDTIAAVNNLIYIKNLQINTIEDNNDLENEHGTDLNLVEQANSLYQIELAKVYRQRQALELNLRSITVQQRKIIDKKYYYQHPQNTHLQVVVSLQSKRHINGKIYLKYFIDNAGWSSFYDLRVRRNGNSYLDHKAYVRQNTGEPWDNIAIQLSNKEIKELQKSKRPNPLHYGFKRLAPTSKHYIRGMVVDDSGERLIGANIWVKGTNNGTITNIDGLFIINDVRPGATLEITYTGYKTETKKASKDMTIVMSEGVQLGDLVVTRSATSIGYKPKKKDIKRKAVYVDYQNAFNHKTYRLAGTYTIPSDGQNHDVLLFNHEINPIEQYYTAPVVSNDVFYQCGITNTDSLGLTDGKLNIYNSGVFSGISSLNIDKLTDTLWIEMGIDEDFSIERIKNENKSLIDEKRRDRVAHHYYEINIKSRKEYATSIIVEDQLPTSDHEDIEISLKEDISQPYQNDNGIIRWNKNIPKNGKLTLINAFEVKYPKHLRINEY